MCIKNPNVLKPRKGEHFFVNAEFLDADSINEVNKFIRFARAVVLLEKITKKHKK